MDTLENFEKQLYRINAHTFEDIALRIFRFQAAFNPVYHDFISNLNINPDKIHSLDEIPFMPISFFKTQTIKTGEWQAETIFASSGTTGSVTSKHEVKDLFFYLEHSQKCFEHFFGPLQDYHFLALLPSYIERNNSSLVAMMDHFIKQSGSPSSGFYLNNIEKMLKDIISLKGSKRKVILWGVSFALLDLAEGFSPDLSHCMVFETGGMKGRRQEITKDEMHRFLCNSFNINKIYSEYGMTELLSQAYSTGHNRFFPSPWMKVIGRDLYDPMAKGLLQQTCGINVVDLANVHSISFIETEDLGKIYADHSFEVLGRFDNSDVRGCNLMVE